MGDGKKFVFLGLDNSGKTCIVQSLQGERNLLSMYSMAPTHGVINNNLDAQGNRYSVWDFGGQESYRKNYIANLKKYFQEIDKFIFVIDITDVERYDLALAYFEQLIVEVAKNVEISVFFHKFDPQLETGEEHLLLSNAETLAKRIKAIVPAGRNRVNFFKTSIYTVFQKLPVNF